MTSWRTNGSFESIPWTALACALFFALTILAANPLSAQTYTVIHNFTGGPGGASPYAGVVVDHAGNLYGTTALGGDVSCSSYLGTGCGIVFELSPSNGLFNILWQFTGAPDTSVPTTVLLGPGGSLYVSAKGDPNGAVVRLSPPVTPPRSIQDNHWIETILYQFQGFPSDGAAPSGNLAMDHAGNIYGATFSGADQDYGIVFKLTNSNGSWSESVLHTFTEEFNGRQLDGGNPYGGVTFDAAGNLYGTTAGGGEYFNGTVYQLVATSGWSENVLYNFTGGNDGSQPSSGVTFDASGNLYSSTISGQQECGNGTVFELSSGSWSFNTLYCFIGSSSGGPFTSAPVFDGAGNLYGTTNVYGANGYGSVFKLTNSNGTWIYTSLHDFTGGSDGGFPIGNLVFDANGNLYGTASVGGDLSKCVGQFSKGCGVVFKITP